MANPGSGAAPTCCDVPFMQRLLDNMWLLVVIGNVVPMLIYVVWGVYDALAIPPAP